MRRLILTTALALGLALPAMAQAEIPQPIHFFFNVALTIKAPGQRPVGEVIRPAEIGIFADGSWDVEHLHWTGWGSRVAHARGISSASNGIPDQADGKRITTPARITLSNPGRFRGQEVYRCFQLTVPLPATSEHLCLKSAGGYWFLGSKARQPMRSTTRPASLWAALGGKVICGLAAHAPGVPAELLCAAPPVPAPKHTSANDGDPGFVFLSAVGAPELARLSQYTWEHPDGWEPKGRVTLRSGQVWRQRSLGITCTISTQAVRCANRSHHGFAITHSSYHAF